MSATATLVSRVPDVDDYRARVRRAISAYTPDVTQKWELERHVPTEAVAALAEADLLRDRWAYGAEGGLPYLVALAEELFVCNTGLALATMGTSEILIGGLTWLGRTPAQRDLLTRALAGDAIGCFAATEAHGGSSLAAVRSTATRVGNGWRVQGTKRYVSNVGRATHAVVLTRVGGPGGSADSAVAGASAVASNDLCLFVVPLDTPGLTIDGFFDTSGVQACDVGQITFDVTLPDDALLGRPGLGLLYASHLLQFERLAICAQLLAAGEYAIALATAYARGRVVAGSRVMDRQAIRHRLAYARAELWNLRSRLTDLVAVAGRGEGMRAHEIAGLKLTAGQRVLDTVDTCMQIFGARGNTTAYPMEKLLRDCRVARIGGGTDEVLADVVASRLDRPEAGMEQLLDSVARADLPVPNSPAWS